jgi:hypothetical protein
MSRIHTNTLNRTRSRSLVHSLSFTHSLSHSLTRSLTHLNWHEDIRLLPMDTMSFVRAVTKFSPVEDVVQMGNERAKRRAREGGGGRGGVRKRRERDERKG